MGEKRLDKRQACVLTGGIFLILAIPIVGIQVQVQVLFFIAWIYAAIFLEISSYSWNELQDAMIHSCLKANSPILFLICTGAMTGIWNISGTIPGFTYAGIMWIQPMWYPMVAYAGCFTFSFLTGSVFSSCGTMGVLFLNIGQNMGYAERTTVAIIIAGAFCGYGISPMSDFVNLFASSIGMRAGKILKAEKNFLTPVVLICLAGCLYLGWVQAAATESAFRINNTVKLVFGGIRIGMPVYIPAVMVLLFMLMRKPAIQALLAGCVSGMAVAFFYQKYQWNIILDAIWNGPDKNLYFHNGGINSISGTILLFFLAFSLFGMLEKSGAVQCMMQPLFDWADTEKRGNMVTVLFAFIVNLFSASTMCSLAISISCLMPVYNKKGWKREKMIGAIFLGSLYMSLLIPWHSNVVTPLGLLGIAQEVESVFGIVPMGMLFCYLLTFVFLYK